MTEQSSGPTAQNDYPEELKQRAREYFGKADKSAYTLNYDYAIEQYLDGLSFWPDALEEGHVKLREIAFRRQASGGKKVKRGDGSKYLKGGKHPRDAMLKAEYYISKDPGDVKNMAEMAKAAVEGHFTVTAHWICDLLLVENRQAEKPNASYYVLLKDLYVKLGDYVKAFNACQYAVQAKPKDSALREVLNDLSARATLQEGRYEQNESFMDSVKGADEQKLQHDAELLIRSDDVKDELIDKARQELEAEPGVSGKIYKLVDALVDTDKAQYEQEAIELLEKAYSEQRQFRFKQRALEISIKQLKRRERRARAKLKESPADVELKKTQKQAAAAVLQAELEYYKLSVENYPTDLKLKHDYGRRLLAAKQYDEAIPMFQESRSDPRHRASSLNCIGQCFFYKEWYQDAIDSFNTALESLDNPEGADAKELRYNLGRSYEADGNNEQALLEYRKVAQIDFNYRDVRDRVDALRKQS